MFTYLYGSKYSPNNHVLNQSMYYNDYCQNPKYQIIGSLDPQGIYTYTYAHMSRILFGDTMVPIIE